jgi:hypothetical protein
MPSCNHHWEPVPRWSSRYRCVRCGAFGYRNRVIPIGKRRSEAIIPYKCKICGAPAVAKDGQYKGVTGRGEQWRCEEHRMKDR